MHPQGRLSPTQLPFHSRQEFQIFTTQVTHRWLWYVLSITQLGGEPFVQPQLHTQTWLGTHNHCHTHFKHNSSVVTLMETKSVRHKHNIVPHMVIVTVTVLLTHCHNSTHIFSQPHRSLNPTQMLTYTKVHTHRVTKDITTNTTS